MKFVLRILAAILASVFALLYSPLGEPAVAATAVATINYQYDSPAHIGMSWAVVTERGPPARYERGTDCDALGRWSYDSSARSAGAAPFRPIAHSGRVRLTERAHATGTIREHAPTDDGGLASLASNDVAANAERGVAMGRNMADRVIPYAEKNGLNWYKGTPGWVPRTAIEKLSPRALEKTDLWFNKRWINNEIRSGSRIVDIGEPPGYPPSVFYNMERQQVSGYWNYVQDIQP
ncbi:MAG: hypothetical protein KBB39_14100 [Phycicoccus sp.]|nr:hypothetical protein [Phycicoccus sp.]